MSDLYRHLVLAVTPEGDAEETMTVKAQPSGLDWLPDGSLLVVSMRDRKLLRRAPDGSVRQHADLEPHGTGKANDMVVDAQGRAYVGGDGTTLLTCVAPDFAEGACSAAREAVLLTTQVDVPHAGLP